MFQQRIFHFFLIFFFCTRARELIFLYRCLLSLSSPYISRKSHYLAKESVKSTRARAHPFQNLF